MRSSTTIDQKHRNQVAKYEKTYLILKAIKINKKNTEGPQRKDMASILLNRTPYELGKVRNRCILTGRGKGVYRRFKMSRIKVREGALAGHLACVRKMSR